MPHATFVVIRHLLVIEMILVPPAATTLYVLGDDLIAQKLSQQHLGGKKRRASRPKLQKE
jgi:hypothetical protein